MKFGNIDIFSPVEFEFAKVIWMSFQNDLSGRFQIQQWFSPVLNDYFSVTECKVTNEAGDKEVYLIHSFEDNEPCFEEAIKVVQSSWSPNLVFDFRSFRFTTDGTSGDSETQNQNVNCALHIIPADQVTEEQAKECSCQSEADC